MGRVGKPASLLLGKPWDEEYGLLRVDVDEAVAPRLLHAEEVLEVGLLSEVPVRVRVVPGDRISFRVLCELSSPSERRSVLRVRGDREARRKSPRTRSNPIRNRIYTAPLLRFLFDERAT